MREVVEDMEDNFMLHSMASKWQGQLMERLSEYSNNNNVISQEDLMIAPVHVPPPASPAQVRGPPPPPPPPAAPAPPRPKLLRFPGAEGLKRQHFSGYKWFSTNILQMIFNKYFYIFITAQIFIEICLLVFHAYLHQNRSFSSCKDCGLSFIIRWSS